MVGEELHEKGREGALFAKRWLNGTARVHVRWTAYDDLPAYVQLPQLEGEPEGFDLAGNLVDTQGHHGRLLYIEVKNYDTEGGQGTKYLDFLAKCYSITAEARRVGVDKETHFMWVTWHPFSLNKWARLTEAQSINDALSDYERRAKYLGAAAVDRQTVADVAGRIFLLVLSRRHDDQLQRVVAQSLAALDPAVSIEATDYFNHNYVPDLILSWSDRDTRQVYLRPRLDPMQVEEDRHLQRKGAPSLQSVGSRARRRRVARGDGG